MTEDWHPDAGDEVVCIIADRSGKLRAGEVYVVRETFYLADQWLISLNIWPGVLWRPWRFKPKEGST